MSNRLSLVWFMVALLPTTSVAQPRSRPIEPLESVRQVLVDVYPELAESPLGHSFSVRLAFSSASEPWTVGPTVGLAIYRKYVNHERTFAEDPWGALEVELDPSGRFVGLRAVGAWVNRGRLDDARSQVEKNPNWSDEEVLRFLNRAGARFLQSDVADPRPVLGHRIGRLAAHLGPIDIVSTEFRLRSPIGTIGVHSTSGALTDVPMAELVWRVEFNAAPADDRPASYHAEFEPFQGKLIRVRPLRNR